MSNMTPAGTPGPHDFTTEICPHCDQPQWPSRMDEHIATAHANIPPCTATLDDEHYDDTLHCMLRAGHRSAHGEYGDYHASTPGPNGRTVWNDTAPGATPRQERQEDNPPVQCWHTEPDTPCDWDVCRQPERLAAGDRGTDPERKEPS